MPARPPGFNEAAATKPRRAVPALFMATPDCFNEAAATKPRRAAGREDVMR